jgi:hypothetical protein
MLTNDERRAVVYLYDTVPTMARVDPNRLPPPPFSDRDMQRLQATAAKKLWAYFGTDE